MKHLILASAAFAALVSTSALANTSAQSGTVTFDGTVAAACSAITPTAATVALGALSNGVGVLNASAINNFAGAYGSSITCNGAGTKLTLWAKPIVGDVPVPTGAPSAFTNQVNYTADLNIVGGGYAQTPVNVGAGRLVRDNSGTVPTTQTVGLLMTDIELNLLNAALPTGASTMVAGTYTGEVVITLTPGA
jgi:hypothetical protein